MVKGCSSLGFGARVGELQIPDRGGLGCRHDVLGRPLGYLLFSLMASIRDPMGFRGQPSVLWLSELGLHI